MAIILIGEGTEESPYLVHNAQELNAVRNNMTAHYLQCNDIDLSEFDSSVKADWGFGWSPIGRRQPEPPNPFCGTYDGGGYKITNLYSDCYYPEIVPPGVQVRGDGLFGMLGDNCVLRNINIIGAVIHGWHNAGALAGFALAETDITINNCFASGFVWGHRCQSGGLLGCFTLSGTLYVTDCHFVGEARTTPDHNGGFIGTLLGYYEFERCSARGISRIMSDGGDGGYAGAIAGFCGGFAGHVGWRGTFTDCFCVVDVYGEDVPDCILGGFIGSARAADNISKFVRCYAAGRLIDGNYSGAWIGEVEPPWIDIIDSVDSENCYWDKDLAELDFDPKATSFVKGKSTPEMKAQDTFIGWDFDTVWFMIEGKTYPMLRNDMKMSVLAEVDGAFIHLNVSSFETDTVTVTLSSGGVSQSITVAFEEAETSHLITVPNIWAGEETLIGVESYGISDSITVSGGESPVAVDPAGSLIVGTVTLVGTSGSVIEITDGGETYTLNNGVNPTFVLPNMFPGEETTVTAIADGLSSSVTFMAPEVDREICESSGVVRVTENKQSFVYSPDGNSAYVILTTISGAADKYGVLAFVVNEDNEIVLNESMTSANNYAPLTIKGEDPFILNSGDPFGANLSYAWRGANTDVLEICVKLCLQGK